jgi:ankyrin repeat protein
VNVKDCDWNTALIRAALLNETKSVKLLLEAKADANVKFIGAFWLIPFLGHPDTEEIIGNTPLIFAALNGNKEMVQALLDAKVDVNAKNHYGQTALMKATNNGNTEIINLLNNNK